MRAVPAVIRRCLAGNKLFALALIPAVLLRVDAELGYRWQSWFNDSFSYVSAAVTLTPDTSRPSGYPVYLWLLSPFHSYFLVTASQHLMGLLVAVMIYALARRRFARPGLGGGAVHAAGALRRLRDPARAPDHDGHALPVPGLRRRHGAALACARPSWRACLVAGLLLGLSTTVRSTGLALIPVFAALPADPLPAWRRSGRARAAPWRALARADRGPGGLRGRVRGADRRLRGLVQVGARRVHDDRVDRGLPVLAGDDVRRVLPHDAADRPAPAVHLGAARAAADRAGLHLDRGQPARPVPAAEVLPDGQQARGGVRDQGHRGAAARLRATVWDDTVRSFDWNREVFPNGQTYDEYLFGYHSLAIPGSPFRGYSSPEAYYVRGNPDTVVVNPFAALIRVYQRYVWLPGTVYGLILLVGLFGIVLRWRFAPLAARDGAAGTRCCPGSARWRLSSRRPRRRSSTTGT